MVAMFLVLITMENSKIKQVDHKFLVLGHTLMGCDSDHSVIEKKKTSMFQIYHPYDWCQLVRTCGKNTPLKVMILQPSYRQGKFCVEKASLVSLSKRQKLHGEVKTDLNEETSSKEESYHVEAVKPLSPYDSSYVMAFRA